MYALCYINIHLHKQGELFGHNHLCHTVNIAMPHPPPPPNHPTSWWGEGGHPKGIEPWPAAHCSTSCTDGWSEAGPPPCQQPPSLALFTIHRGLRPGGGGEPPPACVWPHVSACTEVVVVGGGSSSYSLRIASSPLLARCCQRGEGGGVRPESCRGSKEEEEEEALVFPNFCVMYIGISLFKCRLCLMSSLLFLLSSLSSLNWYLNILHDGAFLKLYFVTVLKLYNKHYFTLGCVTVYIHDIKTAKLR